MLSAATAVGAVGIALNQVFIWPQVARAVRTTEGVAALTVLGGLLARSTWTTYGAVLDDTELVIGNATVAVGFLVLLVLLVRRTPRRRRLLAGALLVAVVVTAATAAGSSVLGAVAVVTAAVVSLPQMARALADRERLAGVSVPTYVLICIASVCWFSYGVLIGSWTVSAPHVVLLPTSAVVTVLAHRSQRAAAPPGSLTRP